MKNNLIKIFVFLNFQSQCMAAAYSDHFGESFGQRLNPISEVASDSEELYRTPPLEGDLSTTETYKGVEEIEESHSPCKKQLKIVRFKHRVEFDCNQNTFHIAPANHQDAPQPGANQYSSKEVKPEISEKIYPLPDRTIDRVNPLQNGAEILQIFQSISKSYHSPFPGGVIMINGSHFHTDFIYSWIKHRHRGDPVSGKEIVSSERSRIRMYLKLYHFAYSKNIILDWINSYREKAIAILKNDIKSGKISKKTYRSKELNGLSIAEFIYYFCSIQDLNELVAFGLSDSYTLNYLKSHKKAGVVIKKPEFHDDGVGKSFYMVQYKDQSSHQPVSYFLTYDSEKGAYIFLSPKNQQKSLRKKYLFSFLELFSSDPEVAYKMLVSRYVKIDKLYGNHSKSSGCLRM